MMMRRQNYGPTARLTTALLTVLLAATTSPTATAQFFRTQGTQIVDPSGNVFLAKGINLNGWLLPEAYGLHINSVHDRHLNAESDMEENIRALLQNDNDAAAAFWQAFRDNWVTEQDIIDLSNQGFNAIRLPFNYRLVSPVDTPGVYSEEGFQILDQVIGWCKNVNVTLLLDMHAVPGGQSHDAYADPEYTYWSQDEGSGEWFQRGVQVLWEYNEEYFQQSGGRTPEFNKQRAADIWRAIAERYRDEPTVLGYELANEPYYYASAGITDDDLRDFFVNVTAAVRKVDTNHIVFVEGNIFAEEIGGLLPAFDDNMVVAFHRYWRETSYEDGVVQQYLDARNEHSVPFIMTESGENSNPWIYEITQLMESNDIGWFYWGFKKTGSIALAHQVSISEDYQYVIDNWRDMEPAPDPARIQQGLMEFAEAAKTENCAIQPGYFAAMLDPLFNVEPQPFTYAAIPGIVYAAHYDIGNQGIAYSDTRYKNEEYQGEGWNLGWMYRNDGVDITTTDESDEGGIGLHVFETEPGEWLKYTVDVLEEGLYNVRFRAKSSSGAAGSLELKEQDESLVLLVNVPEGSESWADLQNSDPLYFPAGTQTLTLTIVSGQIHVGWMEFERSDQNVPLQETSPPSSVDTPSDGKDVVESSSSSARHFWSTSLLVLLFGILCGLLHY